MINAESYLEMLEQSNLYREPVIQAAVDALHLPPGSRGLDAGCGNGFYTLMLAEAAGAGGRVTGLDLEETFLARGRRLAVRAGMADSVTFVKGNIGRLPFKKDCFDWAFSMDLVGHLKADPVSMLKELSRTVRPGGTVAILNWSSQLLLPGYPVLEARLNATSFGIAPFDETMKPGRHSMRALDWFRQAGIDDACARTFAGDLTPPFSPDMRKSLADLFQMRWGEENPELSPENLLDYSRLCSEESPDFLPDAPGYHGFFTYTLFLGQC